MTTLTTCVILLPMKPNKPAVKRAKNQQPDVVRLAWDVDFATSQAHAGKVGWAEVRRKAELLKAYCEGAVKSANENIEAARKQMIGEAEDLAIAHQQGVITDAEYCEEVAKLPTHLDTTKHPEECQCSECWSDERIAALRGLRDHEAGYDPYEFDSIYGKNKNK